MKTTCLTLGAPFGALVKQTHAVLLVAAVAAAPPCVEAAPGDVDGFATSANFYFVSATAIQPNGKILIGGYFSSVNGIDRQAIARLNADGNLDSRTFNPGELRGIRDVFSEQDPIVNSIALQADGKILIGGRFAQVGGMDRYRFARLNPDGSVDPGFDPQVSGSYFGSFSDSVGVQVDGKILLWGDFTAVAGTTRNHIARLNADGTLDSSFNPNADATVYTLVVQPDGKLLIGGAFTKVGGLTRNGIARLNADGTLDAGFYSGPSLDSGADSSVVSLALQADGRILMGGYFTRVAGTPHNLLARLEPDGSVDSVFIPQISGAISFPSVQSIVVQADGKILIGGFFLEVGGVPRNRLARLNADGTLDNDFDPNPDGSVVSLALQSDGKILLGGDFESVAGFARFRIARLLNDPATQSLTVPDASRVIWLRGGASPEAENVAFHLSVDTGSTWTPLGFGTRIPGGWALTGLSLPGNGWVRARARVPGGQENSSSGLVEAVEFYSFPYLTGMTWLGDGSFQFGFSNAADLTFTALASTNGSLNVSNWTALGPVTEIAPGQYQFTDGDAMTFPQRFYLIRSP